MKLNPSSAAVAAAAPLNQTVCNLGGDPIKVPSTSLSLITNTSHHPTISSSVSTTSTSSGCSTSPSLEPDLGPDEDMPTHLPPVDSSTVSLSLAPHTGHHLTGYIDVSTDRMGPSPSPSIDVKPTVVLDRGDVTNIKDTNIYLPSYESFESGSNGLDTRKDGRKDHDSGDGEGDASCSGSSSGVSSTQIGCSSIHKGSNRSSFNEHDEEHDPMDLNGNIRMDSGYYGWLVVLCAFLVNGIIFGIINSGGILLGYMDERLNKTNPNTTNSMVSLACINSIAIGMVFACSIVASILADTIGIRTTSIIGGVLATAGISLAALSTNLFQMCLSFGVIFGIGSSLIYAPSLVILGHYFQRQLGLVNGIATSGSAIFTIVSSYWLEEVIKERSYLVFPIIISMVIVLIFCGLSFVEQMPRKNRVRNPRREPRRSFIKNLKINLSEEKEKMMNKPKENLTEANSVPIQSSLSSMVSSNAEESDEVPTSSSSSCSNSYTTLFNNRLYRLWAFAIPLGLFGYFVPLMFLPSHVQEIDGSISKSLPIIIISLASGVCRLLMGRYADSASSNRILIQQMSFFSFGLVCLGLILSKDMASQIVLYVIYGISDGCFITVLGPIAFDIVGPELASKAIGFLLFLCAFPLTIGPIVAGKVKDISDNFSFAFGFSAIWPIVAALLMFKIQVGLRSRNRSRKLASDRDPEPGVKDAMC